EQDGVIYYTMDLVQGRSLDDLIDAGPMPVDRALEIVEEVARAVHHAHEAGIIHRDLKPANVVIETESGRPVLLDFGLARALDDEEHLTKTGVAIGTPHYMSPEQVRGIRSEIDARSDVWALGVLLYELLGARRPFSGGSAMHLYSSILNDEPPALVS